MGKVATMRRTLIGTTSVGALAAVIAGLAAAGAFAAPGHGTFGGRQLGARGGVIMRPGALALGGFGIRGGFAGGPLGGGFGLGGLGGPGGGPFGGGAGAILGADVLTPAAGFLGISVTTLESDLASGKTLAAEAQAKGKSATDLINALVANEKTILDGEKAAGWITADQETSLQNVFTTAVTRLVNNGPPVPAAGTHGGGDLLQTAATYLGISVSDLQTDLKNGKSLADVISTVSGKTVDGLVAALEAPVKTNLDSAVSSKKITQAQETTILANLTTRLTNLINNTKPSTVQSGVMKSLERYATAQVFGKRHA